MEPPQIPPKPHGAPEIPPKPRGAPSDPLRIDGGISIPDAQDNVAEGAACVFAAALQYDLSNITTNSVQNIHPKSEAVAVFQP